MDWLQFQIVIHPIHNEENPFINLLAEKIYTIIKMRYSNHNYQLPLIIIYRFSDDARQNDDEVPGNAKQ